GGGARPGPQEADPLVLDPPAVPVRAAAARTAPGALSAQYGHHRGSEPARRRGADRRRDRHHARVRVQGGGRPGPGLGPTRAQDTAVGQGITEAQLPTAFEAIDKSERVPKDVVAAKLREAGMGKRETDAVFEIPALRGLDAVLTALGKVKGG